uniref:Uncharacterized protein n=1 Tax=Anguilla anguilla TaxID=7936 RepID=A0A0E9PFA1_ANGAN
MKAKKAINYCINGLFITAMEDYLIEVQ